MTKFLEFDLEIKTTELIRGQGLAKLLAEENFRALGLNFMDENLEGKISKPIDDMEIDVNIFECS